MADVTPPPLSGVESNAINSSSGNGSSGGERTFDKDLFDAVEMVYQRLTKGRHDLKRLKAYMEARGEMARTWVKAMKKASEQPDLEDSSNIGQVWKEIRDTGASQMKQQEMFAAGCHDISVALETQIVEVKKSKTALHATYTKLVADVKKKQQVHDKSKDVYYESVKQAETAVMNRDAAHEQKMPDKNIQKAETRAKQCLKEVETLHAAYQKAVQQLQEAQSVHDVTVVDLLQQFEKLERTRLRIFLDQLERFAAQHDSLKQNLEQTAAALHAQVGAVNIANDVQEFIRANASGKAPAPHVEYVPCKSSIIDHATDAKGPSGSSGSSIAAVPTNNGVTSPGGAPVHSVNASGSFNAAPVGNPGFPPSPVAAVAAPPAHSSAGGDTAVALYDFDQNEPDDLPFKVGEVIKLLSCPEGEDWWQGEKDGRVGIFPKAYVSKQSGGSSAAPPAAPVAAFSPPSAAAATPPVAPPAAPAASSNPFGEDDFGGSGGAAPAAPAASVEGAAGGAEVPKLMDAHCAALFDFDGQDEDELSFKVGQILIITGELNGWYLGRVEGTEKIGIFPSNYVSIGK